jgi:hypothetical protein
MSLSRVYIFSPGPLFPILTPLPDKHLDNFSNPNNLSNLDNFSNPNNLSRIIKGFNHKIDDNALLKGSFTTADSKFNTLDSKIIHYQGKSKSDNPDNTSKLSAILDNPDFNSSFPGKMIKNVTNLAESTPLVKDVVKFVKKEKKEGFVFGVKKDEGLMAYEGDRHSLKGLNKHSFDENSGDIGDTSESKFGAGKSKIGVTYKLEW